MTEETQPCKQLLPERMAPLPVRPHSRRHLFIHKLPRGPSPRTSERAVLFIIDDANMKCKQFTFPSRLSVPVYFKYI